MARAIDSELRCINLERKLAALRRSYTDGKIGVGADILDAEDQLAGARREKQIQTNTAIRLELNYITQ